MRVRRLGVTKLVVLTWIYEPVGWARKGGLIPQVASLTGCWQELLVFWQKVLVSHGRVAAFLQLVKELLERLLCCDSASEGTRTVGNKFLRISHTGKNYVPALQAYLKTTLLPHLHFSLPSLLSFFTKVFQTFPNHWFEA